MVVPQEKENTENLNLYNQRKINEEETIIQGVEKQAQPSHILDGDDRKKSGNKAVIAFLVVLLIALAFGIIYILTRNNDTTNDISTGSEVTDVVKGTEEEGDKGKNLEGETEESKDDRKEGTSSTPKVFDFSNIEKSEDSEKDPYEEEETDGVDPNQRYLFQTDMAVISEDELIGYDKETLSLVRNEIYARHGYIFKNKDLQSHFEGNDWYEPNPNFSESLLNEIEKENIKVITNYEKKMGWR